MGIFSNRDALELQAAYISFVDLLLRFVFTWFCFICGTVPLVFVFDYCKCRRLSEPHFFLLDECHTLSMCGVFQLSTGTVPLNFVGLPHTALSKMKTRNLVSFLFTHYTLSCVDRHTFWLFFWVELSHFSLCEYHTNILVSRLLVSGRSALFPFGS